MDTIPTNRDTRAFVSGLTLNVVQVNARIRALGCILAWKDHTMNRIPHAPRESLFIRRRRLILISLGLIYLLMLLSVTLLAVHGINFTPFTGLREQWLAYPLNWYRFPGSLLWGGVLVLYLVNWFYCRPWMLKLTVLTYILFTFLLIYTMPPVTSTNDNPPPLLSRTHTPAHGSDTPSRSAGSTHPLAQLP